MRAAIPLFSATLLVSSKVDAFTSQHSKLALIKSRSLAPLNVGAAIEWNPEHEDESFLMQRAVACANSEVCSLEDARVCLDDVIHIQSGCATGSVLGDACQNVDSVVEVVANLRAKIEAKTKEALVVKTGTSVLQLLFAAVVVAGLSTGMTAQPGTDMTPFTAQEWWWALRDGYLPQMMSHYFRHGGLATLDYTPETTPFSLEEWWWAVRDGYLPSMMSHFFRNGGLATSEDFVAQAVPFTPAEWLGAIKGGYLDQMLTYNYHHGGLLDSPPDETVALTPQEIYWAARHGYLGTLSDHYIRNGGL